MNKLIKMTALLAAVIPSMAGAKLTLEEHTMQAALQIQEAREKSGLGILATVGDDVNCTYRIGSTRIQNAINSGADEIRIASSVGGYDENLVIDDRSVIIKGGYTSCSNASSDIQTTTRQVISGVEGSAQPTLLISGNSQRNTVTLEQISLDNGEGEGFTPGGGISTLSADVALTLTRVTLSFNNSLIGGGMAIFAGNTDVTMTDTLVSNNTASSAGGGIFCSSSDASLFILDTDVNVVVTSGIYNNRALDGDGGGVLLEAGCTMSSFTGTAANGFDLRGIYANDATGNGGGIAVKSGASAYINGGPFCFFSCLDERNRPANVNGNIADFDENGVGIGGGIYATGLDTVVSLSNGRIESNSASSGGGIAIADQAMFTMSSAFYNCWSPGSCSQLIMNETSTDAGFRRGGGLYATTGATVEISNTMIANNRADFGTALYALAEDVDAAVTSLDVEGALIVRNGEDGANDWSDFYVLRNARADVKLHFNTIADNDVAGSIINNLTDSDMEIYSSIIHNTDGTLVFSGDDQGNTLPYECLVLNEIGTLPAEPELIVDDPEFVDRLNGDYHLNPLTSPAIDFCGTLNSATPDFNDADNDVRGFNDPLATNFLGPYDVGYDETYANDIIFIDGFE